MKEKKNRSCEKRNIILAISLIIGVLIFLAAPGIITIIRYEIVLGEMQDEIESYSPDTYEYLLNAANNIFKEDKVINLNAKPENIRIEVLEKREDKYICELLLDEEMANQYYPIATITVELSENLEILSTKSDYSSKEEFEQAFRSNIMDDSIEFATLISVAELLIIFAVISIAKQLANVFHKKERK